MDIASSQSDADLWSHFEDIGSGQAKCKLCQKTCSFKSSMTNLQTHWERNHVESSSSKAAPETTTKTTAAHQLFVTSTTLTTDDILSKDENRNGQRTRIVFLSRN